MKVIFYNTLVSKVEMIIEATYLPAYLLVADNVHFDSILSVSLILYAEVDKFPDNIIINVFESFNIDNEKAIRLAKETREVLNDSKVLKKIKNKNKETLVVLGKLNTVLKHLRIMVKDYYADNLQRVNLLPILPFYENKILTLDVGDMFDEENKESKLLTEISEILINNNATLSLSDIIAQNLPFDTLTSINKADCRFIKIPLWKFPKLLYNSFEQINYSREQLKPILQPFKDELKKLKTEFFGIDFIPENLPFFKEKINEKIMPHLANIQNAIDENLYLNNVKNKYADDFSLGFCLGIAPAETIVKYYQKTKIIQPFEASEIINRISRHSNLKATFIFTYFEPLTQNTSNIEPD